MKRALGAVAGVLVLGLLGVVVAAGPAAALSPPSPRPLSVPGSVIAGSLDGATALERARAVGNVIPTGVAGTPSRLSIPVSRALPYVKAGGGGAMVATTGFFIGFDGMNAAMRAAGVTDVGLEALFPPEPETLFQPNFDLGEITPPGWNGMPVRDAADQAWIACGSGGGCVGNPKVQTQMVLNILEAPPFGQTGRLRYQYDIGPNPLPAETMGTSWVVANGQVGCQNLNSTTATPVPSTCQWGLGGSPSVFGVRYPFGTSLPVVTVENWTSRPIGLTQYTPAPTKVVVWFPTGHTSRPPAMSSDPARHWQTRAQCSTGPVVTNSVTFNESALEWPAYPDAGCLGGSIPTSYEVWLLTEGDQVAPQLVKSWAPAPALTDWYGTYPDCVDGSCRLELQRIDPATGTGLSCFTNPHACVDWFEDPARADNYRCTYAGGQTVPLSECFVYKPTFNVATGTAVQTGTGTRPAADTNPYGDPATGEPVPADGSSTPGGEVGDPSCPPTFTVSLGGIGYWVWKGVSCALTERFVPQNALDTAAVSTAWQGTAFGDVGGFMGGLTPAAFLPAGGACGVIVDREVPALFGGRLTVTTCGGWWEDAGVMRGLIGAAFILGSVFGGVRMILRLIRVDSDAVKAGVS